MSKTKKRRKPTRRKGEIVLDLLPMNRNFSRGISQRRYALPFFYNPRGLLIHRVRAVTDHLRDDGKIRHTSVHFQCNNFTFVRAGTEFQRVPAGRLVCAACEAFAAHRGKPTADKLAGKHVHVGKIRVEQVCCTEHKDRN